MMPFDGLLDGTAGVIEVLEDDALLLVEARDADRHRIHQLLVGSDESVVDDLPDIEPAFVDNEDDVVETDGILLHPLYLDGSAIGERKHFLRAVVEVAAGETIDRLVGDRRLIALHFDRRDDGVRRQIGDQPARNTNSGHEASFR